MFKFNPYSNEIDADPFPYYETLREEHPCYWSEEGNIWCLSRYDDIYDALNDWETFTSTRGNLMEEFHGRVGNTVGTMDPPRHDKFRAQLQPLFLKRNLLAIEDSVRDTIRSTIDGFGDKKQIHFADDFAIQVTLESVFGLLGLPKTFNNQVREDAVLMVQCDPATREKGPIHQAAFERMRDYAGTHIDSAATQDPKSFVNLLLNAEVDGEKLSDMEIHMTITFFLMAGIESLSGFLAMFMYNMADFVDARKQVISDPSLIPQAIEESLRYNTAAQRFRRSLTKDLTLHGQTMKEGDQVCLIYGSGNRDYRKYPNPHVFDISRKPKGHLGFSGGVHICMGAMAARMVARLVAEEFLAKFPNFERANDDLDWLPSSNFRSPQKLLLNLG